MPGSPAAPIRSIIRLLRLDESGVPTGGIFVGFKPVLQVDDDIGIFFTNDKSIQIAGRTARCVSTVRCVLRVVLAALKAMILRQPLDRGVFVRTGQREGVHVVLEAHEDYLCLMINVDAIRGRNRITFFVRSASPYRFDDRKTGQRQGQAESEGDGEAPPDAQKILRSPQPKERLLSESDMFNQYWAGPHPPEW